MDRIAASIAQIAAEAGPRDRDRRQTVDLPPAVSDALDAWIEAQPDPKPSRPDVLREALAEHLKAKGYLR